MFHRGEKGFTLIELLIVVAILGIIAAVIIPNITAFMTTGRLSAANSEAENVKTAALAYYSDHEAWPATSDDLVSGNYTAGTLKAKYTFDTASGFIADADPGTEPTGWGPTIKWDTSLDLGQRKWVRA
jgi:prepilin-type N-terminal cleavage/methylation domain-containing protein